MKKIFEELSKEKVAVNENNILANWEKMNILKATIDNREGQPNFVFYDGPATANAMPGLHHMIPKVLKDTICKYKTMQGYRVLRKVGWDTHGLPVELEVEKSLGFTSKTDIENYGIAAFNQKCRESVWKNEKSFTELTKKMGQFIDLDNPYVTYDNKYIETEWWILKKFFDAGLLYEGHKIMPYCTRCGTGLASHEVAQGYKEISTDSVVVPMQMVKEPDTYFLVWTTTPWTLLSNVALAVNPNETYVKVASKGYKFILAKSLTNKVLGEDFEVLETYLGKDLEYLEYNQLIPEIKVNKKAFFVTLADYVTMEDGTGIVHIAPAFGEDDYQVGLKYNLPVLNPVNEAGLYTEGPWQDMHVLDADLEVIKYLKANDKLFKKEKVVHNYPHCWRCSKPLLYYAKPSWYIAMTKLKDKLIANNNTVNWYPDYVGEKRFGNWLENLNDWALSRNRYWGTPLNIWRCSCGHLESIGSVSELQAKSLKELPDNVDLHRPVVDEVEMKCPKCGDTMHRVPEVIDCWFDSGSMPFAQYHYPFENEALFKEQFPADFIAEGIDQTRGWFYVLLAISTFVMGKAPYKNVLVNDLLLDKNGQKMSKSKGNAVNPFEIMDEFGADVVRWYLLSVSPVWIPTKFDLEGLREIGSKFFNTLKNTYNFFSLYANTDNIDPKEFSVNDDALEEIDRWLLSKYHHLVADVTSSYDEYDLNKVAKAINEFVSEDLSNWYIRRNRRRFWMSELDDSKKAVYQTTFQVLEGLMRLMAPITPYITEEIYQKLTNKPSVHLADFPKANSKYYDEALEKKMALVRNLISLGRFAREEAKLKVRQPISEILIDGRNEAIINDIKDLIKEELNVKDLVFIKELDKYLNFEIKPNFKIAGPIFGSNIKKLAESLLEFKAKELEDIEKHNINITIDNQTYELSKDMIDIRISAKEGFNAQMANNEFIILNTTLTEDLIKEGIARELVSKVQQLRKNADFMVNDRIVINYEGSEAFKEVINEYQDFIMDETLSVAINFDASLTEEFDLNGLLVKLAVAKHKK